MSTKPKSKRRVVGSVYKGSDGKPDYIKMSQDVSLREGQYVNLESKASQIAGITKAAAEGKLSQDLATDLLAKAEKIPDFVRFNLVVVESQS